jgi:hypothetical protein
MAELDATTLVGLLADAHRRRVVAAIELGASTVEAVATATGLASTPVTKALGKLIDAGLVIAGGEGLTVAGEAFQLAARRAHTRTVSDEFSDAPDAQRKVLRAFVADGRLQSIPVAAAKRTVILDWLAQLFEPGQRYSEAMVNLIIGQRHADTAALRRYMVDEGFLERADGQYWRAGGTVEP